MEILALFETINKNKVIDEGTYTKANCSLQMMWPFQFLPFFSLALNCVLFEFLLYADRDLDLH